jgi:HEAT repeat protein
MKSSKETSEVKPEQESDAASVEQLLVELHSHNWKLREGARWQLESLHDTALFPLMDALNEKDWHVRWEAAKALRDIADARAAPALVKSLRDRRFGVRWLAAEGLISMGEGSLPALLDALVHQGDSILIRDGARHVLRELLGHHMRGDVESLVRPVFEALEDIEPSVEAPVAARRALQALPPRVRRRAQGHK